MAPPAMHPDPFDDDSVSTAQQAPSASSDTGFAHASSGGS
jgi:hypothetical protein